MASIFAASAATDATARFFGVAPLRRVTRSIARQVGVIPGSLFGTNDALTNRRRRRSRSAELHNRKRTMLFQEEQEEEESSTEDIYETGSSDRDDSSGSVTGGPAMPLLSISAPVWPRYATISLTIASVVGVPCLADVVVTKPLLALDTMLSASVTWLVEFVDSNVDVYTQSALELAKATNWQLEYAGAAYSCHPASLSTFRDLGVSHRDVVVRMVAVSTAENASGPEIIGRLSLDDPADDLPLVYSAYPTLRRVYYSRFRRGIRRLGDSGCYPKAVDLRGPNVTVQFMRRDELVHGGGGDIGKRDAQLQLAIRRAGRREYAAPLRMGVMDESGTPIMASATVGSENLRDGSILTLFVDIRPPSDMLTAGPRQLLYVALTKGTHAQDENVYCIPVWCSPYNHTLEDLKDAWLCALYMHAGAARADAVRSNFRCVSFTLPGDRTCRRLAETGDFARRLDYWKIPHGATVEMSIKMVPLVRLKNHSF